MRVDQFDYHLPQQLIAQQAAEPRDSARLMRVQTQTGGLPRLSHHVMRDLPDILRPDDLLVMNDTRVLQARLHGHKTSGGKVEALLLNEIERNLWEVLLRPSARLKEGAKVLFETDKLHVWATCEKRLETTWHLRFEGTFDVREVLPKLGQTPLPPYIHTQPDDPQRYQTVYAKDHKNEGEKLDSAAAPTAGLHFTPELLEKLRQRGIGQAFVTLGIGLGTFLPVKSDTLEGHHMHREHYVIPQHTARAIAQQRSAGKRVVAVGTTVARTLEAASERGPLQSGVGSTEIFIYPPYRFRCVDALLTNFHLPRSTLLAMVSALAGHLQNSDSAQPGIDAMRYAYKTAVEQQYRFFSFGDGMLIE